MLEVSENVFLMFHGVTMFQQGP